MSNVTGLLAGVGLLSVCCLSSSFMAGAMGGESPSPEANGDTSSSSSDEQENALDFEVGTPIQCNANDVGSGVNAAVYRYMGGTELRHYPDPPIASSWDPDWHDTFKKIDCKGLTEGDKMPYNVTVGEPVQCNANDVGAGVNAAVYRVAEGGVLRWYPNPPIASSWDSDWHDTFKKINCIGLTKGDDMAMKS